MQINFTRKKFLHKNSTDKYCDGENFCVYDSIIMFGT